MANFRKGEKDKAKYEGKLQDRPFLPRPLSALKKKQEVMRSPEKSGLNLQRVLRL